MVEVGTWSAVRVPAATVALLELAVTGIAATAAGGDRGDAGHINRSTAKPTASAA